MIFRDLYHLSSNTTLFQSFSVKKTKIAERIRLYTVFFYKNHAEIRAYKIALTCFKTA